MLAKTKTEAIKTNVISPFCLETIKDQIDKVSYVGVLTDANHNNTKLFPIMLQFFDENF